MNGITKTEVWCKKSLNLKQNGICCVMAEKQNWKQTYQLYKQPKYDVLLQS
jgi:hypothetical protein